MTKLSKNNVNRVISQWARLGAMFNVSASRQDVDLERLLLDTTRHAAANSRLIILAVTWLAKYGQYVAKHRLAHLIRHELEKEHQATMGLMLDLAREKGTNNSHRFNQAINACAPADVQRPLLDVDQRNDFFVRTVRANASALSLKWGRWMEDFELKNDAIRPAQWIVKHNPAMRWRGDYKGDLRASILAELDTNPDAASSESALARTCGATRTAVRDALRQLEMAGRVSQQRQNNRNTIHPSLPTAA
ncbi:MAG: hypothetical protein ABSH08_02145 [Tepidisphaeraceae bacterium]